MQERKLADFFCRAYVYVTKHSPNEIKWAQSLSRDTFRRMSCKNFLKHYVGVVYVSGFKASTIEQKLSALKKAFHNFDLKKIYKMKSIAPILSVFNNKRKANSVLEGVKYIKKVGYCNSKKRILALGEKGPDALDELPGIGPINKNQLARDIGIADVPKNDVWIKRLTKVFLADDFEQMTGYLAKTFNEKQGVIDVILWRFCADNAWKYYGYPTLEAFIRE